MIKLARRLVNFDDIKSLCNDENIFNTIPKISFRCEMNDEIARLILGSGNEPQTSPRFNPRVGFFPVPPNSPLGLNKEGSCDVKCYALPTIVPNLVCFSERRGICQLKKSHVRRSLMMDKRSEDSSTGDGGSKNMMGGYGPDNINCNFKNGDDKNFECDSGNKKVDRIDHVDNGLNCLSITINDFRNDNNKNNLAITDEDPKNIFVQNYSKNLDDDVKNVGTGSKEVDNHADVIGNSDSKISDSGSKNMDDYLTDINTGPLIIEDFAGDMHSDAKNVNDSKNVEYSFRDINNNYKIIHENFRNSGDNSKNTTDQSFISSSLMEPYDLLALNNSPIANPNDLSYFFHKTPHHLLNLNGSTESIPTSSPTDFISNETKSRIELIPMESDVETVKSSPKSDLKKLTDRKVRRVYSNSEIELMERIYISSGGYPGKSIITNISRDLGVDEERVRNWFQNRRAKQKKITNNSPSNPVVPANTDNTVKSVYPDQPFHHVNVKTPYPVNKMDYLNNINSIQPVFNPIEKFYDLDPGLLPACIDPLMLNEFVRSFEYRNIKQMDLEKIPYLPR